MSDPPIELRRVSKRYLKLDDTPLLTTEALRWRTKTKRSHIWALRNVDLSVRSGESVGVIGHNGSGKSTLMRLLGGITAPSRGRVAVRGRIAPLISVGVGFHPELSGRENVFLNGLLLGLSRSEIDSRFDEIVDFSGVAEFIDTPVKFYSSGMFMRLGFATSVVADPDIMLVDEVLSVGDVAFQMKCFNRLEAIRESGAAVVLVSHNLAAIRKTCSRVIVLDRGRVRFDGDPDEAIALLYELLEDHETDATSSLADIEHCDIYDAGGAPIRSTTSTTPLRIATSARLLTDVDELWASVLVYGDDGAYVYGETHLVPLRRGRGERFRLDVGFTPSLASGTYRARILLVTPDGSHTTWVTSRLEFFVAGRELVQGIADLSAEFRLHTGETGCSP